MTMTDRAYYSIQTAIQNSFFQMPKFLFENDLASMSNDARVLYALLRDRQELSIKNRWYDGDGNVYIYYKREDMGKTLNLSERTICKIVKELKSHGLMVEKKQGQGKPNRLYLCIAVPRAVEPTPSEVHFDNVECEDEIMGYDSHQNLHLQTRNNYGSKPANIQTRKFYGSEPAEKAVSRPVNFTVLNPQDLRFCPNPQPLEITGLEGEKNAPNKTEYIKTEINETEEEKKHPRSPVGEHSRTSQNHSSTNEEQVINISKLPLQKISEKIVCKKKSEEQVLDVTITQLPLHKIPEKIVCMKKPEEQVLDVTITQLPLQKIPEEQGEYLKVKTATGAGTSPVYHTMTLAERRFEQFWEAYPKKGKSNKPKKDAQQIWQKINPDEALFLSIMSTLETKKQWWETNQIAIEKLLHASSWLKKEFADNLTQTRSTVEQYFAQFWAMYPRKVSKIAAEEAWMKIIPDETLFMAIMQGLEKANEIWAGKDVKYIPHASTWLNGEKWNDEIKEPVRTVEPCIPTPTGMSYKIGSANDPYLSTIQSLTTPKGGTTDATVSANPENESLDAIYQKLLRERMQQS